MSKLFCSILIAQISGKSSLMDLSQGLIQDFPEGHANLLFGQFSRNLHENEENWTEVVRVQNFSM